MLRTRIIQKEPISEKKNKTKKTGEIYLLLHHQISSISKKSPCVSLRRLEETHLPDEFMNRKLSYLKIKVS